MPSSAVEVPVDEERGGEGVADLNDELPEDSTGLGRLGHTGRPAWSNTGKEFPVPPAGNWVEWGLQDSLMSNMAAEHSVMVSSSSIKVSEVLRLRDL